VVEVLEKFDARCAVSARWARGWVEALGKKKKLAPDTSEVFSQTGIFVANQFEIQFIDRNTVFSDLNYYP